jgi:hypothetical protein
MTLRRPGLSDLSPCVSGRQWFEPYLRRSWKQAGIALHSPIDSIPWLSESLTGPAMIAIRSPKGRYGSYPKNLPVDPVPLVRQPLSPQQACGKFSTT